MVQYSFSLENFEIFILILVRVSCFVYIAPFYGMSNVPNQVKIGLSAMIALLVSGFADVSQVEYTGLIGYAVIVLKEGITGLLIGLAAVSYTINNTQVTLTGNLYNYFILMLLVVTDMHHYILRAFVDAFTVIPVNGQVFDWEHLMKSMTTYMGDMFVIAFRIILPVFACIMILNCILGIMAKVSPQMNMFAVGMQMKIMVGFVVLFLTVSLLPSVANFIFTEMKKLMVLFIEGMY